VINGLSPSCNAMSDASRRSEIRQFQIPRSNYGGQSCSTSKPPLCAHVHYVQNSNNNNCIGASCTVIFMNGLMDEPAIVTAYAKRSFSCRQQRMHALKFPLAVRRTRCCPTPDVRVATVSVHFIADDGAVKSRNTVHVCHM
jgi:hypothetical protein